jgi:hypothetical protein
MVARTVNCRRPLRRPHGAESDECGKPADLLARPRIRADERAEQFYGTLGLPLAESADEQLQPLPRCHVITATANAKPWRLSCIGRPRLGHTNGEGQCAMCSPMIKRG